MNICMFESRLEPLVRKKERNQTAINTDLCVIGGNGLYTTWYRVILSSFCSIGVSLPHVNAAPLATKNQCLIVKNRWGCRRIFECDVKTHKHEVKFSPAVHAPSSSCNQELLKVGSVLRAEKQMAQLRGLHAPGVIVAQALCEAWSLTMLSPLR